MIKLLLERIDIPNELNFYDIQSDSFLYTLASYPIYFWVGYLNTLKLVFSKLGLILNDFTQKLIIINLGLLNLQSIFKFHSVEDIELKG